MASVRKYSSQYPRAFTWLSSFSFALVANHVADSSNLPASKASHAMSEAICIAFAAASARSLVFSFAAARSASSFLELRLELSAIGLRSCVAAWRSCGDLRHETNGDNAESTRQHRDDQCHAVRIVLSSSFLHLTSF